jgi:hypothetical protein
MVSHRSPRRADVGTGGRRSFLRGSTLKLTSERQVNSHGEPDLLD